PVAYLAPDDQNVAHQRRRRGRSIKARRGIADALHQIDDATIAEVRAWLTRLGIERDHAGVMGQVDHPGCADFGSLSRGIFEIDEAATRGVVADCIARRLRIESPEFRSGCRVQGTDLVHRRAEIKAIANLYRRVLVAERF